MWETPDELSSLQGLLDRSFERASEHLKSIMTDERRLGRQPVHAQPVRRDEMSSSYLHTHKDGRSKGLYRSVGRESLAITLPARS